MGVAFCAAFTAVYFYAHWQDEAYYRSLSYSFAPKDDPCESVDVPPLEEEDNTAPVEYIRPSLVDFESKRHETPGIEAWIRMDGTTLNYPVMYAIDNDYYLDRLPNGKKSSSGSIFIDCRNSPDFSDKNTMVYGHRMKSGAMFGALKYFVHQSYYDKHPVVSLFTPKGDFEVQLFASYSFDQTVEVPPTEFENAEEFDDFVRNTKRRSTFKSDVEVNYGDRLVTLVTCEYTFKDGRLIVVGKLVEK